MKTCSGLTAYLSLVWLSLFLANASVFAADNLEPALLKDYLLRVSFLRKTMPEITRIAEAVAEDQVANPGALFSTVMGEHNGAFGLEVCYRAGGLVNMDRPARPEDNRRYFVYAVRTWPEDGKYWRETLQPLHEKGIRLLGFGPSTGRPSEFSKDWWIDDGAPDAAPEHGPMNGLANITAYWVWCCEYAAALTRHGKHPGVLMGLWLPGSDAHNNEFAKQEHVSKLYDCKDGIPAGQLGEAYLQAAEAAARNAFDGATLREVELAATHILKFIADKKTVGVCGIGHYSCSDVFYRISSPFKPFHVADRPKSVSENLKEGDLLIFLTDWQLNLPWCKYVEMVRKANVQYLAFLNRALQNPDETYADALGRIHLDFAPGDASVDVPFPPGKMAPVSSIEIGLIYRLLDWTVSSRQNGTREQH